MMPRLPLIRLTYMWHSYVSKAGRFSWQCKVKHCLSKNAKLAIGISSGVFVGFSTSSLCEIYDNQEKGLIQKRFWQNSPPPPDEKESFLNKLTHNVKRGFARGRDIIIGLTRFGHAAAVVVSIIIDYKSSLINLEKTCDEYKEVKSACHTRSAVKLRDLCCMNGGVFIKVGQHLGSLDFLLPREYVETLRILHNEAPQSPFSSIRKVVEEELGMQIHTVFSYFEEKPIGAASLAQVHRGVLLDGRKVAVKVQHKEVQAHAYVDMVTIEFLVKVVAFLFPDFHFQWLVEEMKRNIPLELDFIQEGKNCNKVEEMFRKFSYLKVPKIWWDVSAQRLLTMEYFDGGVIDDLDYYEKNSISPEEVSTKLGRLYSEMIFVQGFIHCDPHPGNILVRKSTTGQVEIILLDHGLYQTLTDDFRLSYCKLWKSLIAGDINSIKAHCEYLGVGNMYGLLACMLTARSWESINSGIEKVPITQNEVQEIQKYAYQYIPEITEVLNRIPRQMILILKTNDLLRGIDSKLHTRATSCSFVTMLRCCVRAMRDVELKNCDSFTCRMCVLLRSQMDNLRISLYQFSLTPVGKRTLRIWSVIWTLYIEIHTEIFEKTYSLAMNKLYELVLCIKCAFVKQ